MTRDQKQVGELITQRRRELALSAAALADRADVDAKTLRSLERGERWPQEANRTKIEVALRLIPGALDELLDGAAMDDVRVPDDVSTIQGKQVFQPSDSPLRDLRRIGRILGLDTSYFEALNDTDARPVLAELTIAFHRSGLADLAAKRRHNVWTGEAVEDFVAANRESSRNWELRMHDEPIRPDADHEDPFGLAAKRGRSRLEQDDATAARRGEESQDADDWT